MNLDSLNDRQREAVLETDGPLLILAGAGSGKTRVLTSKIAYLIEEKGASPYEILAFTFTNKAANEMKERVGRMIDFDVDKMWIGTFHSICVRVLRRNIESLGYTSNFTIYDRDDQKTLVKEILKEKNLSDKAFNPNGVLNIISNAKNKGLSPEGFLKENSYGSDMEAIAEIYRSYQEKSKKYNALDFDDLILKTLEVFEKDEEALSYYQNRFSHVFVDEYQDTNHSQYQLIRYFSDLKKNVCVVGDADQSIYGWRGADISNINDFEEDYPGAKTILLEENYRSSQNILDTANKLIEKNFDRKKKNLWTEKGEGAPVYFKQTSSEDGEVFYVTSNIKDLEKEGYKLKDMAILYRTNAQSRAFEEGLMREGINYRVIGGLRFYDRKEIRDLMAYLKLLINKDDNVSLKRVINTPKRGIGLSTIEKLDRESLRREKSIYRLIKEEGADFLSNRAKKNVGDFIGLIDDLTEKKDDLSIGEMVKETLDKSGYREDLIKDEKLESRTRLENIDSFVNASLDYQEAYPDASLDEYINNLSLMSDVDKTDETTSGVNLMTIHSAKGLEYKVVFVTGMEEGLFPSSRSIDEGNLEEERRLCYVALTRAEERLFLSSASTRRVYGKINASKRSRFIDDMEDTIEIEEEERSYSSGNFREAIDYSDVIAMKESIRRSVLKKKEGAKEGEKRSFKVGDKVSHKSFGDGIVVSTKEKEGGDELVISFDKKGIKRLNADLAPLKRRD